MTDPIETELRSLLAQRAATVTTDAVAGEATVARRLEAGDEGLAHVIALPPNGRRRIWVAAAAVAGVVALGAAIAIGTGDDPNVETGPAATTPTAPAAVLEFRPVLVSGPCAELGTATFPSRDAALCYDLGGPLPGNELLATVGRFTSFSSTGVAIGPCDGAGCPPDDGSTTTALTEEAYGVALTLTPDGIDRFNVLAEQCFDRVPLCPTGQLAVVIDGVVVSAPTVQQPGYGADEIQISGDFTEQEADALALALEPVSRR